MEDKRLLLAVTLSLAVLIGWQMFFGPKRKPLSDPAVTASNQTAGTESESKPSEAKPVPATVIGSGSLIATRETEIRDIVVDTDLYTAVINTAGGSLKSFKLKKFKENAKKDSPPKELISESASPDKRPFAIDVNIGGKTLPRSAVFKADADKIDLTTGGKAGAKLTLSVVTDEGFTIERVYEFAKNDYLIAHETRVKSTPTSTDESIISNRPATVQTTYNWFTTIDPEQAKSKVLTYAAVVYTDSFDKEAPAKLKKKGPFEYKNPLWAGFADSYFLRVIAPDGGGVKAVADIRGEEENGDVEQRIESAPVELAPNGAVSLKSSLFCGPKDHAMLKAYGDKLKFESAVEYGRLEWIVKGLVWILKFFNRFVNNWGLSIILLTVFVRLCFFPLSRSSFKQMKAMQALQPRIKELQEKYADDKQKLNEEMWALYRTNKVNPVGGCLPMLLQLPVLYALYRALYVSIDLRHAEFAGWILDLSSPEQIFVLPFFGGVSIGIMPLFMGASMYVQQKMTPTTMDPMQAKMFMMMPFMFALLSFNFPSGLVLYWTVSNLISIAQQYVINRRGN